MITKCKFDQSRVSDVVFVARRNRIGYHAVMGWRGVVRSLNAASNAARRERERQSRAAIRQTTSIQRKIDEEAEVVLKRAEKMHDQLIRDPIEALNIRFDGNSFVSDSIDIGGEYFQLTLSFKHSDDRSENGSAFRPSGHVGQGFIIEPLKMVISRFGVFIAFRVANLDPAFRFRLNWVKKERESSSIYLLDDTGANYYYPISSTLTGEVVAGAPKIGIVAFEPFRARCESLSVHISGVKLQSGSRKEPPLVFKIQLEGLAEMIERALAQPSFLDEVQQVIAKGHQELSASVLSARSNPQAQKGCLLFLGVGVAAGAVLLRFFA